MTTAAPEAIGGAAGRQYLTFVLGNEHYGVEILRVQEIRGYTADVLEIGSGQIQPPPEPPPPGQASVKARSRAWARSAIRSSTSSIPTA